MGRVDAATWGRVAYCNYGSTDSPCQLSVLSALVFVLLLIVLKIAPYIFACM